MVVGPISVTNGPQYRIELEYWHTGGRWWLYYNGTQGSNAIGYYPKSLYKGGALAGHATEIDYGGETVGTTTSRRWAVAPSRTRAGSMRPTSAISATGLPREAR